MRNKILISEMAKLHNISTQTLRYYDKINLFKPTYIDEENNYRYYGVEQFSQLDSILFLKSIGTPLKEIKAYINNKSLDTILTIVEKEKKIIDEEIKKLIYKKEALNHVTDTLNEYKDKEIYDRCYIRYFHKRNFAYIKVEKSNDLVEFEYSVKEISKNFKDKMLFFTGILGVTIDKNIDIKNHLEVDHKETIMIFNSNDVKGKAIKTLKSGRYVTRAFTGKIINMDKYLLEALKFIRENNLEINGDIIVLVIAENYYSDKEEEYISEVQIPIK